MDKIGFKKENQPEFMHFTNVSLYGCEIFISRTGYTGEDGFELLIKNENALKIWQNLLKDGEEFNLEPIGLGARNTLRLEAALPLHGNELNEQTTPIEAGLKWSIPKDKEADYIGKNKIIAQLKNGTNKKLIGFELLERGIARSGDKIFLDNKLIGMVTSGTMSPISKISFGIAYINNTNLKIDDTFKIDIRGKLHLAKIVKRPFVDKAYVK
jgi:aminomethyltransferase